MTTPPISNPPVLYQDLWMKIFRDHFEDLEKYHLLSKDICVAINRVAASHLAAARTLPMVDHIVRHSSRFQHPGLSDTSKLQMVKRILTKCCVNKLSHLPIQFPLLKRIGLTAGNSGLDGELVMNKVLAYSYQKRDEELALSFDLRLFQSYEFEPPLVEARSWSGRVAEQIQTRITNQQENAFRDDPERTWEILQTCPNVHHLCTRSKVFQDPNLPDEEKLRILENRCASLPKQDNLLTQFICLQPNDLLESAIQHNESDLFNSIDLRLVGQPEQLCFLAAKFGRDDFAIKLLPHISERELSTKVFPKILLFNSSKEISALRTGGESLVDDTTYPSNRSPKEQEEIIRGRATILDHLLSSDSNRPINISDALVQLVEENLVNSLEKLFQLNLPYNVDYLPDEKLIGVAKQPGLLEAFYVACRNGNVETLQVLIKCGKSPQKREILESTRNYLNILTTRFPLKTSGNDKERLFYRTEFEKLRGTKTYNAFDDFLTDIEKDFFPQALESLNRALQEEFDVSPVSIPEYTPEESAR